MKELINKHIQIEILKVNHDQISFLEIITDNALTNLHYWLHNHDCLFELKGNQYYINIEIDNSYFKKYKDSISIPPGIQELCCNIQNQLYEIINCKLKGDQRSVYMESIALRLILYTLKKEDHKNENICEGCIFLNNPPEKEKIQNAREYILKNLNQQLTIPVIANTIGTNQCYLKKGFKEIYGKTINEFVIENRMVKANHLLKNTNKKLFEISEIVGYSSASSFSKAYSNYFGVNPSLVSK